MEKPISMEVEMNLALVNTAMLQGEGLFFKFRPGGLPSSRIFFFFPTKTRRETVEILTFEGKITEFHKDLCDGKLVMNHKIHETDPREMVKTTLFFL